jgi:hypothetical protein
MENRNMRDGSSRRNRLARGLTMVGVVGAMVVGFLPLGLGVTAAGAATATGGQYVPITPVRIADTRTGSTFPNAGQTMPAGGSVTVALPSSVAGASAVALNVTATNTTGSGFFTVYPAGGTLPLASSLNFSPGANVPNFVIVPVGASNSITIYNGPPGGGGSTGGAADAVVDLQGSFNTVANTSGGAGHFNQLTPARITDTRAGSGQTNAGMTLTAGGTLTVQATGKGGVPATGVSAVEVNVTEAANTAGGFLTVFPQGNTAPTVSNLNFVSGQIVANRVIVPVNPANGQFNIFNHAGNTDVVVDVDGYFTDSTGASGAGSLFNSAPVARVIDTRSSSPIGPNGNLNVPITGIPSGASAAVLNVTEASNTAGGFLTVSPTTPAPLASDVNFVPGVTVANGDIAALASNGSLNVFNHDGNTNVVLDVAGYFTAATSATPGIPAMVSATVTNTAITITYNQAVNCAAATSAAFAYLDTGTHSGGTIPANSCTTTGNVLTLTATPGTFTLPSSTATIVYTANGASSTANAVFATSNPTSFAATQTIPVPANATVPAMVSATATATAAGVGHLTITYNEAVTCPTNANVPPAFVYDYTGTASGGAITTCAISGTAGNVLTLQIPALFVAPDAPTPNTTTATITYTAPPSQSPPALNSAAASVSATGSSPTVYAANQTLSGAMWTHAVMMSAVVTPGASGTGTITVTYSEAVECPTAAVSVQTDFAYSNGGAPAYPSTCIGGGTPTLTLGTFYNATTGTTAATLVAPVAADTLGYTQPATPTIANAVYAGTAVPPAYPDTYPQFAPTQTIGLAAPPFMVSAHVTGAAITITYNAAVTCTGANSSDFVYQYQTGFSGGAHTAACSTVGNVLTLTADTSFTPPTATANIVYTQGATVYVSATATSAMAQTPQTISGSSIS